MHFLSDRHHPSAKIGMETMKTQNPRIVVELPKTSLKILGVTCDSYLRWDDHVNSVSSIFSITRSFHLHTCLDCIQTSDPS